VVVGGEDYEGRSSQPLLWGKRVGQGSKFPTALMIRTSPRCWQTRRENQNHSVFSSTTVLNVETALSHRCRTGELFASLAPPVRVAHCILEHRIVHPPFCY